MARPANIKPRIVEGLYTEALILSDEVRAAFDLSGETNKGALAESEARVALSCEALRTTTRMMHAVAWLLNHRAYLAGELSEFQLRRHGRLADFPHSDPARIALLDPEVRELIGRTERLFERLRRLDHGWRTSDPALPGAVERLRERVSRAALR